jgi:glutamine amidotransferase
MNIGIISTSVGNVGSIERMVAYVGAESTVISAPHQVFDFGAIILPGVGYFSHGMEALVQAGLDRPLIEVVAQKKIPILGICLGMQLFCEYSEEGDCSGLGLIKAQVQKFNPSCQPGLKVPHMGWNAVEAIRENPLLPMHQGLQRFYFVHSYYVKPVDSAIVIGESAHGHSFCSAFQQGNIFGVQFHPEKSHRYGAALIKNFIEYASNA